MGDIINLNKARKAHARAAAPDKAAAKRARFGRSRAERDAEAAALAHREALLDGARRETDET